MADRDMILLDFQVSLASDACVKMCLTHAFQKALNSTRYMIKYDFICTAQWLL